MAHGLPSEEFWKGKLEQLTEDLKENAQSLQKQTRRVKEDAASDGTMSDGKDWWDTSFSPKLQKQIDLVNELEKKLHEYLDASQAFQKANRLQEIQKELKMAQDTAKMAQDAAQARGNQTQARDDQIRARKDAVQATENQIHARDDQIRALKNAIQAKDKEKHEKLALKNAIQAKDKEKHEKLALQNTIQAKDKEIQILQIAIQAKDKEKHEQQALQNAIQAKDREKEVQVLKRVLCQELQQWQRGFIDAVLLIGGLVALMLLLCHLFRKTRRLPEAAQNTQPLLGRSVAEELLRNSASVLSILNQVHCILGRLRGDSPWHFVDPEHRAESP